MKNKIFNKLNITILFLILLLISQSVFSYTTSIGVLAKENINSAVETAQYFENNSEKDNVVKTCDDCENCNVGDCECDNCHIEYSAMAPTNHIVKSGDTMWKIAVKYEIGLAELIKANSHIKNPALIYVGQSLYIPETTPLKSLEDEVIRLVNIQRVNYGLQTLKYNWEAARVARIKSQDMINNKYFSHISPVYGSPFKMMEDYGLRFSAAAENIAKGQTSAQQVVNSWMNSDGHRANILGKSFTEIGVGAAKDANGTITWTQIFLKPV